MIDDVVAYLDAAFYKFGGASDRVQQAMDAVLEIRLAQRRAQAAASSGT